MGVDDIIVNSNNVPVKNIMKLFYDWFIRNFKTGNLFSYSEEVFYDVTTRVGVNFEEIDGIEERTATNAQILCHICERVKNKDENVQKKIGTEKYKKYRWLHAFSELTKTMERMSKTVIMDELVYLILPSVNALWEILENHIKDKGNIAFSEDEVSNIQNYVENLENLMEHILRFEGQLTQNPETRPILYDMPVTMLEYTLALLSECNKILCDAKETQAISYLIVPRFCQRIEAQEIFYATNDSPGLVIISIPLHMMYDSRTIQATLCHEVAHFVVTPHRKLDERVKYFATATAILIAKVVFNTYNRDFINKIRDDLQNIFTKENSKHISQMQDKVIQWLKKLVYNYENYSNFISEFLLNVKDLKDLKISANLDDFKYRFNHDFLQLFIKEMRNFFREIFADICMFILRETNPEAYIDDLVKDINKGSTLSDDSPYEQFAIRIYVCLDACGKEIPECPKDASAEKIMLYQYLSNIKKNIKETKEPKNAIIPMGVIKQLIKYSKECYNSLTLSLDESEDSAKCLRDFKKKNGDNVTYEHLEEIIDNYRKFILDTMGEEA